jgi:predicted dehydrogenase
VSPDELRVGVIGCGFQGRLHVECLGRIPGAHVVAVCDRDPVRAAAVTSASPACTGATPSCWPPSSSIS